MADQNQIEELDELFVKGFNNGYLLSKHEPQLLGKLLSSPNSENQYYKGLTEGRKQFQKSEELKKMNERDKSQGERDRDQ